MILCSDPHAQYLAYKDAIDAAVQKVLESGRYLKGAETEAFENEFAAYISGGEIGGGECLGVSNGTDALEIALTACGVGPGDEVITVSHTATATAAAIAKTGALPVFADINPDTFVMDVVEVEKRVTEKTKAIIPVHLYGHPAPMAEIMTFARANNLFVIEDCAQAHGAQINGRKVGSFGDLACFSFYPTKNLSALGDAGGIVSSNSELLNRCRTLSQYGWQERFVSSSAGWNSRMDEVQAAVLRIKLAHLEDTTEARRTLASIYHEGLAEAPVGLPVTEEQCRHVFHLYVIKSDRRDAMLKFLETRGINAAVHYPVPVHCQPAYASGVNLPVTEKIADSIISLPMYPELGDRIEEVVSAVNAFQDAVS